MAALAPPKTTSTKEASCGTHGSDLSGSDCRTGGKHVAGTLRSHPFPITPRLADRSWVFEYMALLDEDHRECLGGTSDRHAARHMRCHCEDMDLRAFQLVAPERELLAYRTFAVCAMCHWWAEF